MMEYCSQCRKYVILHKDIIKMDEGLYYEMFTCPQGHFVYQIMKKKKKKKNENK